MTYNEVLSAVFSLGGRGMDFGTERTRNILNALDCPDTKLKIIHIAGTNGKGSVAEFLTRILIADGKRVGTFTSPAVFDYSEQFRIVGKPLEKELYARAFGQALKCAGGATRFEVETAGALYAFALAGCEYAVVECGLGGTYDATNAILKKEVAVITSIGLEHTAILGNTLADICKHKAGIIKHCPAVVSGYNPPEVINYFKSLGAAVADKPIEIIKSNSKGHVFIYGGFGYEVDIAGSAQPYNAATAIEAARLLNIGERAVYLGVQAAKLCGRCEVLTAKNGRVFVLDGAHNPAAFQPLAELIKTQFGKADVIYGSLADKNIRNNLEIIKSFASSLTLVPCNSPRNIDMQLLKQECLNLGICAGESATVTDALENSGGKVTVVCGSFTLIKEAIRWIENK